MRGLANLVATDTLAYDATFALGCILNILAGFANLGLMHLGRRCTLSDTTSGLLWMDVVSFIPLVAYAMHPNSKENIDNDKYNVCTAGPLL